MGLLDDAIREHLELKRLRGVDPSEVTRNEREALGPVNRDEDLAAVKQAPEPGEPEVDDDGQAPPSENPRPVAQDLSHTGQETAELDMRTVLEGESTEHRQSRGLEAGPRRARPVPSSASSDFPAAGADSPAGVQRWGTPSERTQERLWLDLRSESTGDLKL